MYRKKAIEQLRSILKEDDISAMIIPSNDPHFGEYIPDYYKCREWLSGFTGSAGTLVITENAAALWTDSRYFIQAQKELSGSDILLMKMKVEGTPSISDWLKSNLGEDDIVALDEDLFSYQEYVSLLDSLAPLTATLIEDPFDSIWKERPQLQFNKVSLMDESISGESVSSKHHRLVEALNLQLPFAYIISALDEVAWLCNIRGTDVEYNPLVLSYAVVENDKVNLFLREEVISKEALSYLTSQGVVLYPYEEFSNFLTRIDKKCIRIFSGNKITAKNHFASLENVYSNSLFPSLMQDPIVGGALANMKARKNSVELEGFRRAYIEDGKAWNKLIAYIKENVDSGITEYDVAAKLVEYRSECPDYRGESFEPIVAYGANAALPHYSADSPEKAATIKPEGFLLIDTGGQYTYGTTDTTRTIPLGVLTQEEKDDYTRVLKGMIDMSMAKFPKGIRGCLLDILARGPIFNSGKMYLHGTCHGIGHNLCVHEGPQSVRMEENPVTLDSGMVMSNEPAVYVEGKYGIRHENTVVIKPWQKNNYGEFLEFETITRVPIDTAAINYDLLNEDEKEWLKSFNN
jgi:Xaa-Pro aminopeptidase